MTDFIAFAAPIDYMFGVQDHETPPSFEDNPSETSGPLRKDLPIPSSPSNLCFLDETDSVNDSGVEDCLSCSFEDSDVSEEEDNDEEHTEWQAIGAFKLAVATWKRHGRQPTDSNTITHLEENKFRKASGSSSDSSEKPEEPEGSSSGEGASGSNSDNSPDDSPPQGENHSPSTESPPTDNLHDQVAHNQLQQQQPPQQPRVVPPPLSDAQIGFFLFVAHEAVTRLLRYTSARMKNDDQRARNQAAIDDALERLRAGRPVPDLGMCGPAASAIMHALDTITRTLDGVLTPTAEQNDDAKSSSPDDNPFEIDESTMDGPPLKKWKKDDDEDRGAGGAATTF